MLVKNLHGTSDNTPPKGFSSWLEYWESVKGRKAKGCSVTGCGGSADVGGHVKKVNSNDESWHITPLCYTCNARTDNFDVPASDLA